MCADSYIDAATLGHFVSTTGGQLHYYPQFRVTTLHMRNVFCMRTYLYMVMAILLNTNICNEAAFWCCTHAPSFLFHFKFTAIHTYLLKCISNMYLMMCATITLR